MFPIVQIVDNGVAAGAVAPASLAALPFLVAPVLALALLMARVALGEIRRRWSSRAMRIGPTPQPSRLADSADRESAARFEQHLARRYHHPVRNRAFA